MKIYCENTKKLAFFPYDAKIIYINLVIGMVLHRVSTIGHIVSYTTIFNKVYYCDLTLAFYTEEIFSMTTFTIFSKDKKLETIYCLKKLLNIYNF